MLQSPRCPQVHGQCGAFPISFVWATGRKTGFCLTAESKILPTDVLVLWFWTTDSAVLIQETYCKACKLHLEKGVRIWGLSLNHSSIPDYSHLWRSSKHAHLPLYLAIDPSYGSGPTCLRMRISTRPSWFRSLLLQSFSLPPPQSLFFENLIVCL